MANSIHHIPGRLRIRSALTRSQRGGAEGLARQFRAIDGVLSTQIGERTGSLNIIYDLDRLDAEALHRIVSPVSAGPRSDRAVSPKRAAGAVRAGEMFGKAAFDVFVEKALERSVVSLLTGLR